MKYAICPDPTFASTCIAELELIRESEDVSFVAVTFGVRVQICVGFYERSSLHVNGNTLPETLDSTLKEIRKMLPCFGMDHVKTTLPDGTRVCDGCGKVWS